MARKGLGIAEGELLRQELKTLHGCHLYESTFDARAELIAKLGIMILPLEDLKSRRILCRFNLAKKQ
jgi:hypothetical protein